MTELETNLLNALKELTIDMKIAQGNMRIAAIRDLKWEGCAEAVQPRVDAADAAIAAAEAAQPVGRNVVKFFAYDDETGFDLFDTADEAKKAAQVSIDEYRHGAGEGWPEGVENVCWGVVLGVTKEVPIADSEGNSTDWAGDRYVDYVLDDCQQPSSSQPVATTDEVKRAVEAEREACANVCENLTVSSRFDDPLGSWVIGTLDCASAIRARGNKHLQSGANSSTSQ